MDRTVSAESSAARTGFSLPLGDAYLAAISRVRNLIAGTAAATTVN